MPETTLETMPEFASDNASEAASEVALETVHEAAAGNVSGTAPGSAFEAVPSTASEAAPDSVPESPACALPSRSWAAEWRQLQRIRKRADDATFWDKRARTFGTKDAPNRYVDQFLARADIHPGESVFDMGCGTGALSVPLGAAGHHVVAADFSAGMLGVLGSELDRRHITSVTPVQMSWEDNWDARGVGESSVDVCLASRSIAVADLEEALLKLTRVARRRVCVTLSTGSSPRIDESILDIVGLGSVVWRDYLYAFNILAAHGIKAEVSYIESERFDTFNTPEDAFEKYAAMIRESDASHAASPAEIDAALERLRAWLGNQLVENENAGAIDRHGVPEGALRMREARKTSWAFLAWNK